MDRSHLFRLMQRKIDGAIGDKLTGQLSFRLKMYGGGVRQCESRVTEALKDVWEPLDGKGSVRDK